MQHNKLKNELFTDPNSTEETQIEEAREFERNLEKQMLMHNQIIIKIWDNKEINELHAAFICLNEDVDILLSFENYKYSAQRNSSRNITQSPSYVFSFYTLNTECDFSLESEKIPVQFCKNKIQFLKDLWELLDKANIGKLIKTQAEKSSYIKQKKGQFLFDEYYQPKQGDLSSLNKIVTKLSLAKEQELVEKKITGDLCLANETIKPIELKKSNSCVLV